MGMLRRKKKQKKKKKKQTQGREQAEEEAEAEEAAKEEAKQLENKASARPSKKRMKFNKPIGSEGGAANQIEAPGAAIVFKVPGHKPLKVPARIQYLGSPDKWRKGPRLGPEETAASWGWQPCQCNGFCRPKCPGRSRHPPYARTGQVRCPNPATSLTTA